MPPTDITVLPEGGVPQPPPPPRGRARRVTVGSIVSTVVLSIFATLLGPLGVLQSASAAIGATVTWNISSEPAEAKAGYVNMIRGINQAISSHEVRARDEHGQRTGRPVQVTDSAGTNQFITVDLHAEDRDAMIRVFMRRSDSYVMGFRQGTTNTDGTVNFESFFPLEENVNLPGSTPGTGGNVNTRYVGQASYVALGQRGATRDGLQITPAGLSNAVRNLQDSGSAITPPVAARSILQIIVALAEASRFRNQAAATATAFGNGQPYTVTAQHIAQHNNWSVMSAALLSAIIVATAALSPELEIGGAVYATAAELAQVIMMAHHSDKDTKGKGFLEGSTLFVAPDGFGDYTTVQAAINAAPEDGANSILIDKGSYHEVINVPADKTWLTIEGVTGNNADVLIWNSRAHGMINPSTGAMYGTGGSAVATFKPANLTVQNLKIVNTFDPAAHPEIGPYETQAVAVAAQGDRQVYRNVEISSRQDTLLVKGTQPTDQARQYFVNCLIRGTVDFIFGNATAVIDRSSIRMTAWPGGTILAPNTDYRKKYGILITDSEVVSTASFDSMYLGRPWHNVPEAHPQAVVRNTLVSPAVNDQHPWTSMVPEYPWSWARFKEYKNSGLGAGAGGENAPRLTDAEALEYTAQKYLAGTDGWNPVR